MERRLNMILELTSFCNLKCGHCLREQNKFLGFYQTYDLILQILDKIQEFYKNYPNIELKLSGGEATIWKERDKTIRDIFFECKKRNLPFSLVSNGVVFNNQDMVKSYLGQYMDAGNRIKIYLTIDNFHGNYDLQTMRSKALDNLLSYMQASNALIDLYVQSTFCTDAKQNLPQEFIRYYADKGVKFMVNPLLPWGKGMKFENIVPLLQVGSADKSTLGSYKNYLYILGKNLNKWNSYYEFENLSNWELLKMFNYCGESLVIENRSVYYCMGMSGKAEFLISDIKDFSYEKYAEFKDSNVVCQFWKTGELDFLYPQFEGKYVAFGYGVCDLCRKIQMKKN